MSGPLFALSYSDEIDPKVASEFQLLIASLQNYLGKSVEAFGRWVDVPYASNLFSAKGGTWTVSQGNMKMFRYAVVGEALYLNVYVKSSSLSAAVTDELYVYLPHDYAFLGGGQANGAIVGHATWFDSVSGAYGVATVRGGDSSNRGRLTIQRDIQTSPTAWPAPASDGVDLGFNIVVPIGPAVTPVPPFLVEYLVVGAGAGGGSSDVGFGSGGGGSAGEVLEGVLAITPGSVLNVTVGAKGNGGATPNNDGSDGGSSALSNLIAAGGKGGGKRNGAGRSGRLGGGGGYQGTAGGTGTLYNGGAGNDANGRGGGGAGSTGAGVASSTPATGGTGGPGWTSSISGASVTYARGANGYGAANGTNKGDGGQGADGANAGGNGVDGIVIIRYQGAQRATGGTVTTSGGYTIHTFTTTGASTFAA